MTRARLVSTRPEEGGAAVAFLASSDASYITAATLLVDGGFSSRGTDG